MTSSKEFDLSEEELNDIFFKEDSKFKSRKLSIPKKVKKVSTKKKKKSRWDNKETRLKEEQKEDTKIDTAMSVSRLGYYEQRKVIKKIKDAKIQETEQLVKDIQVYENLDSMIIITSSCEHMDRFDHIDLDGRFHSICEKCSRDKIWEGSEWVAHNLRMKRLSK